MDYADSGAAAGVGIFMMFIWIAVIVVYVVSMWKVFTKAGRQGWEAIIPIYNLYVLCLIAKRPGWWLILYLIPFVNIIISLIVSIDIAKNFDKSAGFGIGLWLLGIIFWPILGFGNAQYLGETADQF